LILERLIHIFMLPILKGIKNLFSETGMARLLNWVGQVVVNKTASLTMVYIFTQKTSSKEKYYGNLGQDFTSKFDGFVLNFKSMYFKAQ
jgi:hypothetical protein